MTRLFTADFSTGDFSQWGRVINRVYPSSTRTGYLHPRKAEYSAEIVSDDPDCGYCTRLECRGGEVNSDGSDDGTHRNQLKGDTASFGPDGSTRWYAWSWKFDKDYPSTRNSEGKWGALISWKDASINPYNEYGTAPFQLGWTTTGTPFYSQTADGYIHLFWSPQSAPFTGIAFPGGGGGGYYGGVLLKIPLNQGQWQDFKVRAVWKKDNTGTFAMWHNGVRQTFLACNGFAGGTTFTGQTFTSSGGPTGVDFEQHIYRNQTNTITEIVSFAGARMADTEDTL